MEELDKRLPGKMKKFIADNDINLYTIDGIKIGKEIGLGAASIPFSRPRSLKSPNIIPELTPFSI